MTADMRNASQKPTLEQIENELRGKFVAIGVLLNECFYRSSGDILIGAKLSHEARSLVDLSKTTIGRHLPIFYAYAFEGRVISGYENDLDPSGEIIELLRDFSVIFRTDSSYFDLCLDVAGLDVETDTGHLDMMISLVEARASLDSGSSLSINEVALLANMTERSVKNALGAEGIGRLMASKNGQIENGEAHRWLAARRGFIHTQRTNFPDEVSESVNQLDALEIPAFIRDRLFKYFGGTKIDEVALSIASSPFHDGDFEQFPELISAAAKTAGVKEEIVQGAIQQPLRLRPEDCANLAKAIHVDPIWLTLQVMRAMYPTPMDMILNPDHYAAITKPMPVAGNSVDVVLTTAMVKHGYLDLPSNVKSIFPADCFGTREKGDFGTMVEIEAGNDRSQTDIRIKSERTISPRKRFGAFFSTLNATVGDVIRITRTGERTYCLSYVSQ